MDNYLKAKGIFEKLDAKANVATCLHSIGILHEYKGEIDTALAHYQKAYDMYEGINHRGGMASGLNALGIGSSNKGDYDKALDYHNRSLAINEAIGDKNMMVGSRNKNWSDYKYTKWIKYSPGEIQ